MHVTIINDCRDENAKGRQMARVAWLCNAPVSFIGVSSDLEAAGNLIDVLDAYGDASAVVLVNVAPRNGASRKWGNGTPFGYFRFKNCIVLASIEGNTLSLVKKLKLADSIAVLDIPTSLAHMKAKGIIDSKTEAQMTHTQFRSFEFLPLAAQFLMEHGELPHVEESLASFPDAPQAIWWVDNFGNCKTTFLSSEAMPDGLPFYEQLKSVPDGAVAVIVGSSGIGDTRFLEIVEQGGSAAHRLQVSSGATIDRCIC